MSLGATIQKVHASERGRQKKRMEEGGRKKDWKRETETKSGEGS